MWRVAVAGMVAYRAEMVIWILSATLPLVMLALWDAAATAGPLAGFGQTDFARYFTVTMIVRQLTGAWIVWELNYAVRSGTLSPQLLRPVNPLIYNLFETLAAIPWRLLVLIPLVGGLVAWRPEVVFAPVWWRVPLFAFSILLAFAVAWLVQALFGMLAFWFDQAIGIFSVHFALWSFFSGYIIPMALLPDSVAKLARWLPFYSSLGAPVDQRSPRNCFGWWRSPGCSTWPGRGASGGTARWAHERASRSCSPQRSAALDRVQRAGAGRADERAPIPRRLPR
jgi:ABC-2 type transport system permease protein